MLSRVVAEQFVYQFFVPVYLADSVPVTPAVPVPWFSTGGHGLPSVTGRIAVVDFPFLAPTILVHGRTN